jgi:hypothetical protein
MYRGTLDRGSPLSPLECVAMYDDYIISNCAIDTIKMCVMCMCAYMAYMLGGAPVGALYMARLPALRP